VAKKTAANGLEEQKRESSGIRRNLQLNLIGFLSDEFSSVKEEDDRVRIEII
jgi:hypothetical protein